MMTPSPIRDAQDELPLALLARAFARTVVVLPSGARVAVRRAGEARGDAPTVVLLHGISSGAASWLNTALALAPEAHVIAWDAPGYGESSPLAANAPSAIDYADRLAELLKALAIDSCVIVGHSLGALMAAACAQRCAASVLAADSKSSGTRIQRLVLISPARGYGAPNRTGERNRVLAERLAALRRLGVAGLAEKTPARLLTAQANTAARAWVGWNTARLDPAGYTQAVQMLCHDDLGRYVPASVAVEVHCGDADTVTPPNECSEVARDFAAPFATIAHAGHASPIEQPEAVAHLIANALKQRSPPGRSARTRSSGV